MTAYVCSRYSAESEEQFEKQLKITKEISRELVSKGHDVIVPHLYYPRFLDDNDITEREAGIASAVRLLEKCDAVFAHIGLGVSEGMHKELSRASVINKTVYCFRNMNELKDILKRLDLDQENRK